MTSTAAEFGLSIKRLEPDGARTRVTFEDIKFDMLLLWIERVETDGRLYVIEADMDRRPEPGVVSARLTLER